MKYHVEAKDNAKFLGSIEKASHCIYLQVFTFHLQIAEQWEAYIYFQDPDQMNQSLMKLLQIMKMIYQVRQTQTDDITT